MHKEIRAYNTGDKTVGLVACRRYIYVKYYLGILTFKCLNGLAPDYLSILFKDRSSVHDINTRNNEKLNIPAFSSAVGQRSFEYRAVSLWNSLPADITVCDNLNFKFYKFLLENFK